MSTYVHNVN